MKIQNQFPDLHWIWKGGISFVYEVHPRIVVKVPKAGDFEREQFQKELKIYELFSRQSPCPSIVQCFYFSDNGIFLEYMRGATPVGLIDASTKCVARCIPLFEDTGQPCPRPPNYDSHRSEKARTSRPAKAMDE